MSYTPPANGTIGFSFVGSLTYVPPLNGAVKLAWPPDGVYRAPKNSAVAAESGLVFSFVGAKTYIPPLNGAIKLAFGSAAGTIEPTGIAPPLPQFAVPQVGYHQYITVPTLGAGEAGRDLFITKISVRATFVGATAYAPPPNGSLGFSWFVGGNTMLPAGIEAPGFGTLATFLRYRQITVAGIDAGRAPAAASVVLRSLGVSVASMYDGALGTPGVRNYKQFVAPFGFTQSFWDARNSGTILNWRQPTYPPSFGGEAVSNPNVRLATATQITYPSGIAERGMGAPIVSPRYVFPVQFNSSAYGTPNVQLPPHPAGFDSSVFGRPTVLDNHQTISPLGIAMPEWGFPNTRRLQEYVYPPSVLESTLFGDVRPILRQRYVPIEGTDTSFISPFASVDNRNRQVLPTPMPPPNFGTTIAANKSPNLTPTGINSLAFGGPDIGYNVRPILFAGAINPGPVGTAVVKNAAATVAPNGFDALLTSAQMVSYRVRTIPIQTGIDAAQYGTGIVWFRVRGISSVGGSDTALYGRPTVDLKDRRVLEAGAIRGDVVPAPTAWYRVRTLGLENLGIGWDIGKQFGGTTVADATKRVYPGSILQGEFGAHSARRNEVVVYPAGITSDFGTVLVDLHTRYVAARSFLNEEVFGPATFHNDRQYVAPFTDPDSQLLMGGVGTPWDVSNRNRIVGTNGFDMSLFSKAATVELTGRDIHPVGLDSMTFGTTVLGARVRTVAAEGWDSFFSRFTAVYNRSAVLEPSGIRAGFAGVPSILDRRQYMDAVGGNDMTRFGTQFVAFRIRGVSVIPGIEAPRLIDIDVALRKRYIAPTSIEGGLGVPTAEIHRNLVGAKGYLMDSYGEGIVRNVTPEVKVYATLLTEYGKPTVYNRNAFLAPAGFSTIWGNTLVDFRVKSVRPSGFEGLRIPTHNVQFDAPQLPPQQIVNLDQVTGGPGGIYQGITERPSLLLRGMYVVGFDAVKFGAPTCISYGIGPVTLPWDANQFGVPTLNGTQYVTPSSIEFKQLNPPRFQGDTGMGDGAAFVGTARITPYTISLDVNLSPYNIMDYDPVYHYPWWGTAVVTQRLRTLQMSGYDPYQLMGTPDVQLRKRYVLPIGFNSFKYGVPSIPSNWFVYPFWGRTTEQEVPGVNIDPAKYGTAAVAIPVPPGPFMVYPSGITTPFLAQQVDLFNRRLNVLGFYSNAFSGDTWVHPPIKVYPSGFDSLAMGALATGLKYRWVYVDSSDLDTHWGVEYDGGIFPMTVRLRGKTMTVPGIPPGNIGAQYVGLRQQPVTGVGDDFGVVPMPAVLGKAKIAPEGFNSLQMGTPKQPVYGVVEPQGEEMLTFGRIGLNLGFRVPGLAPAGVGLANVQRGVNVTGLHGDFGSTVVVGESNCGSTLAVIAMLGDTLKFGSHGVHR